MGKVHFTHLWFGPFTLCLPVVSILTLCPLEVLFFNSVTPPLTLNKINTKLKKKVLLLTLKIVCKQKRSLELN